MVPRGKKVWPPGATGEAGTLLAGRPGAHRMALRRPKGSERKIAPERIHILFRLAEREASKGKHTPANPDAGLAAKNGVRDHGHLPPEAKRGECPKGPA